MVEWWQTTPLQDLNDEQWEALCDGCAKCCLHKFEDEDNGQILFTRVHCRFLDMESCRCTDYANRSDLEPACIRLSKGTIAQQKGLPTSCAYRMRAEGSTLAYWHPLVSGDPDSVHRAGASIRGRSISAEYVHPDELEAQIVRWVDE
ncbi:MAG: YcgN family cysteine cluster protein [Pseudomonadota bacterium]